MAAAGRKPCPSRTAEAGRPAGARFRGAVLAGLLLPGVGPGDTRVDTDPTAMPWAAVARMQVPGISRCSAVVVAPHWVVTAAHCLGVLRLGHVAPAGAVHLLLGYRDGVFRQHVVPDGVVMTPEAVRDAGVADMAGDRGGDVALLHVAATLTEVVAPEVVPVPAGTAVALGGYGQDRAERLEVDGACHARGYARDGGGRPVLLHDCNGTRGSSGGALLRRDAAGVWHLVGLQVAARRDGAGGVAVPGFTIEGLIPR